MTCRHAAGRRYVRGLGVEMEAAVIMLTGLRALVSPDDLRVSDPPVRNQTRVRRPLEVAEACMNR